jgi:hypothetical protein
MNDQDFNEWLVADGQLASLDPCLDALASKLGVKLYKSRGQGPGRWLEQEDSSGICRTIQIAAGPVASKPSEQSEFGIAILAHKDDKFKRERLGWGRFWGGVTFDPLNHVEFDEAICKAWTELKQVTESFLHSHGAIYRDDP